MCSQNGATIPRRRFCNCNDIVIILGSIYYLFMTIGMMQSFGILYVEILDHFKSNNADTSWISSLSTGLTFSLGPLAGVIERKYGGKILAIAGSLFVTVGMASSMFVTAVYHLYFTYGILTGIGFAFLYLAGYTAVSVNITKGKSFALGFVSAGGGVGTISLPFIITYLLKAFNWRWTFLLLSAISLLTLIPGILVRLDHTISGNERKTTGKIKTAVKEVLCRPGFILFTISGMCIAFVYLIPFVMTPKLAISRGIMTTDTSLIITAAGVTNVIGKLAVGLLVESTHINPAIVNGIVLILYGIMTFGCTYFRSLPAFIVYGAVVGISIGTYGVMLPIVSLDLIGEELFSMALGLIMFFQGIAVTLGPPVAGWIADSTGDYVFSFYFAGVFYIAGGILSCLVVVRNRCINRKHTYKISTSPDHIDASTYM